MISALLTLTLFWIPACSAAEFALVFEKSGKEVGRYSAARLKQTIKAQSITLHDQKHRKTKSYRAFPIKEVMAAAFGKDWEKSRYSEVSFVAADGYASLADAAKLTEDGGWLAFEDLDVPDWELIGRKKANPGPFYLVWSDDAKSTENEYPWPWQLATVNLIKFEERYPEVVPTGAGENSGAARGFKVFRGQCLRCHAMNMQGGKIGPDLNAPQSIVNYRTKEWIKEYIRQPSKFRYTEMPDHPQLTDRDLENLYDYFRFKAKQPEKSWDE